MISEFKIPLHRFDLNLLPADARQIGSEAFKMAVGMHFAAEYAASGQSAIVTVDDKEIGVMTFPRDADALDMIMPKLKLKRLKEKEAAAAAAGDNVKDAQQLRKELDERLIYLVDNITFEVFNYSRRGLFDKHKLIVATMLLLRVLVRRNEVQGDTVDYLVSGPRVPNPPPMTAKVQEYLTVQQWAGVHALKEIEFFKSLPEDLELNVEAWREFVEHPVGRDRSDSEIPQVVADRVRVSA